MATQTRHKTSSKTIMVRVVCFTLAALMLLSVLLAAVWQW